MKYQNKRGGRIVLSDIKAPVIEWSNPISALEDVLVLKKKMNETLLTLHGIATCHKDPQLCDFLETEYLKEQVDAINQISKLITNAKRCGDGVGVYQFDKLTMSSE